MAEVAQDNGCCLWSAYKAGRMSVQSEMQQIIYIFTRELHCCLKCSFKAAISIHQPFLFLPLVFLDTCAPCLWAELTDTKGSVNPTAVSTEEGTVLFLQGQLRLESPQQRPLWYGRTEVRCRTRLGSIATHTNMEACMNRHRRWQLIHTPNGDNHMLAQCYLPVT